MGFRRNLTAGEIVDQILEAGRITRRRITNVVFMGMGEPLMNYDNLMKAIDIIVAGIGIAARHITVSTAGWADRIRQLAEEGRRVKLAVSLHSANNETRTSLMPVNRKFNLDSLIAALEHYYTRTQQRITFEYIFFDGINDSDAAIEQLVRVARRVPNKINVIPFHSIAFTSPTGYSSDLRPSRRTGQIVEHLRACNLSVFVRSSSGEDIAAACGQLALANNSARRSSANARHQHRRAMQHPY
jgi:23S rRNA (adenine2503-C2)-methyltransferase